MLLNCIVAEDNLAHRLLISSYIEEHPDLVLEKVFDDSKEARKYLLTNKVDIVFADMEMPSMTGIEMVRGLPDPSYYIFITSHPQFAVESYEVNAGDYLIKPLDEEKFLVSVAKAKQRLESKNAASSKVEISSDNEYFVVRADYQYIKVKYSDILFIQAMEDFVKIQTVSECHIPMLSLKFIEENMPSSNFMKVHRSFLVNLDNINSLDTNEIKIRNHTVPIGQSFRDKVIERFTENKLLKKS